MKRCIAILEHFLQLGGIKKDITLLVISGAAVVCSLLKFRPFSFDMAWVAIILCGVPIVLEALIGLVTAFDIKADVGIAMGGVGSDIAVDAADIALIDDEVKELPHLAALSKRMMTTIKLNMTFSMVLNFVAVTLAIIGTLNPVIGALVHNAGSVLVIINSAFLLKWRKVISGVLRLDYLPARRAGLSTAAH